MHKIPEYLSKKSPARANQHIIQVTNARLRVNDLFEVMWLSIPAAGGE
jgi:hypothetical protein